MAHDDDIPTPDAPETPAEAAHARRFAELVDGVLAGDAPPPALAADDRNLLETATMIRAATSDAADLAPATLRQLVDDALAAGAGVDRDDEAPLPTDDLARRRARRLAPWIAVAAAAAAALVFALRPPRTAAPNVTGVELVERPSTQRSRPGDELVGRIDRGESAEASTRLDAIYADRSAGYRAVRFHRIGGAP